MSKLDQPYLRPIGKDEWIVTRVWHGYFNRVIPKGFVCDLDSVPRVPFVYAKFKGRARGSAVGHDWDYRTQTVSRKVADQAFYDAMRLEGVARRYAKPMYWTLRAVGRIAWNKNKPFAEAARKRHGVTA